MCYKEPMSKIRSSERQPAFIHARIPADLYESVADHAASRDQSLSESLRQLLIVGLGGSQLSFSDSHGTTIHDRDDFTEESPS